MLIRAQKFSARFPDWIVRVLDDLRFVNRGSIGAKIDFHKRIQFSGERLRGVKILGLMKSQTNNTNVWKGVELDDLDVELCTNSFPVTAPGRRPSVA